MNALSKIGKYLFLVPFLMFGIMHFMKADMMVGMVPEMFPAPKFFVYLVGVGHLAAVVAVLMNKYAKLGMQLLGFMLMIFVLTIYMPGAMGGDSMAMSGMLKDMGLAAGAWILSGQLEN